MRHEKVRKLIEEIKALPEFNAEITGDVEPYSVEFGVENCEEWLGISNDHLTPEDSIEGYDLNSFHIYESGFGFIIGEEYKFSTTRQQFYTKDYPAISVDDILHKVKNDLREYWYDLICV